MEILNVRFEGYISDDVVLILFANVVSRLPDRRRDEWLCQQNVTNVFMMTRTYPREYFNK